ncbi:hypothetical protein ACEWY4_027845 [Coilia grayii]|uniref:Uncharacterized protein n=1 Tax=Coilia grayii TaxID=363190 RepID=A0ABD1INH6_9TELE
MENDEGWTTVRYGRRRRRIQLTETEEPDSNYASNYKPRPRDTSYNKTRRTYAQAVTTAPTYYTRTRNYSGPQRPPPWKQTQYNHQPRGGQRPQTYYGTNYRPRFNTYQRTEPNRGQNRVPYDPNPEAKENIRIMHKVITLVHHLSNIEVDEQIIEPPTITRMTDYLTQTIKPALPNEDTLELLEGNARNWAYTTLLILKQHYTNTLDTELDKLTTRTSTNWQQQFEIATRMAKRQRGKRLQPSTINIAEEKVKGYIGALPDDLASQHSDSDLPEQIPEPITTKTQPTTNPNNTHSPPQTQRKIRTYSTRAIQTDTIHDWSPTPATHETPIPNLDDTMEQDLITLDEDNTTSTPMTTTSIKTIQIPRGLPQRTPRTTTAPTEGSPILKKHRTQNTIQTHLTLQPINTAPSPTLPQQTTPILTTQDNDEHITLRRVTRHLNTTHETPIPNLDDTMEQDLITLDEDNTTSTPMTTTSIKTIQIPRGLPQRTPRTTTAPTEGSPILKKHRTQNTIQTHLTLQPINTAPSPTLPQQTTPILTTQDNDEHITLRRVTRHLNSTQRLKDWTLSIWKPTLIIGDSNLARIEPFEYQDVQIESYPGTTFFHAETLLRDATVHSTINNIILSFGINCRTKKVKETTIKQIQRTIKITKDRFPEAHIYIPIINFSSLLPATEITALKTINSYLERNCPTIPPISKRTFRTTEDKIHWTSETANNILRHWMSFLNFSAP